MEQLKQLSDEAIKEAGQSSNSYGYGHNYEGLHNGRAVARKAEQEILRQVEKQFIWGQVKFMGLEKDEMRTMRCISDEDWQKFKAGGR